MMLIYYKTWIYQCLIKQVKSPSICSHVPETGSDPPFGSSRESGRDSSASGLILPIVAICLFIFRGVVATTALHTKFFKSLSLEWVIKLLAR